MLQLLQYDIGLYKPERLNHSPESSSNLQKLWQIAAAALLPSASRSGNATVTCWLLAMHGYVRHPRLKECSFRLWWKTLSPWQPPRHSNLPPPPLFSCKLDALAVPNPGISFHHVMVLV